MPDSRFSQDRDRRPRLSPYSIIHHEWKDSFTHLASLGAMNVVDLPAYSEQVLGALRCAVAGSEALQVSVPARARPAALFEFLDKHGFF